MPHVRQICRLLQGVPLALELAASWTGVLSCRQLADALDQSLDLLENSSPDVPERHRSLRNAFEHSWRLLDATERRYFAQLSVFQGGFRLEAAQQVAGLSLPALGSLVRKSLVVKSASGRFDVHPVLRQFAAEKLAASGQAEQANDAHCDYFISLLHDQQKNLSSGAEKQVLEELVAELGNIRKAWSHAASHKGVARRIGKSCQALFVLLDKLGWAEEGSEAFALAVRALEQSADTGEVLENLTAERDIERGAELEVEEITAIALARRAAFEHRLGRSDSARELLHRSHRLLPAHARTERAFVLDKLAVLAHERGENREATELLRAALAAREESGDPQDIATSLNNLGSLAFALGNLDEAESLCKESLAIQQRVGSGKQAAISLQNLASIAFARGEEERAETLLAEGLVLCRALNNSSLTAIFLANLASLAGARGSREEASAYLLQALQSSLEIGAESLALGFLPRFALLLEQQGECEKSMELCSLLLDHPLATPDAKTKAEQQLLGLASRLDPKVAAEAQARGKVLGLAQVTEKWLRSCPSPLAQADA